MKFVLILTLFGMDSPDIQYVIDHNMTGFDCIQRFEQQQEILEKTFDSVDFVLSCEMDDQYED
jgi:hypothetical protein